MKSKGAATSAKQPLLPQSTQNSQTETFATVFPPLLFLPRGTVLLCLLVSAYSIWKLATDWKELLVPVGLTQKDFVIYVSIPVVSIVFTYVHIWAALYLTFYPISFFGCLQIPGTNVGLGWQGIIPHKAEKMSRLSVRLISQKVLSVHQMFKKVDAGLVAKELKPVIARLIPYIVDLSAEEEHLNRWRFLPQRSKRSYTSKAIQNLGQVVEGIMAEMTETLEEVFDLEEMVVTALTSNPALLNHIFISAGYRELELIRDNGARMGGIFGILQVALWKYYSQSWTLPVFGGIVGLITNWVALKVIFAPVEPIKLGTFVIQGLFLRRQAEVSAMYGKLVARHVLSSQNIMRSLLTGTKSDKFYELIQNHVNKACNRAVGNVKPLVVITGRQRFRSFKRRIADNVSASLEVALPSLEGYMNDAMQLETHLTDEMRKMCPKDFEQLLHPVFEEDEWKLLLMGGVLGVLVGFCQWHVLGK